MSRWRPRWPRVLAALALSASALALPIPPGAAAAPGPSVAILSPAAGATVTSLNVTVRIATKNFTLNCRYAGTPDKPGVGHVHVMIDAAAIPNIAALGCSHTRSESRGWASLRASTR